MRGQRAHNSTPKQGSSQKRALILAYLGDTVKTYHANYLQLLDRLELVCRDCQGACHRHGWRKRTVRDGFERAMIRVLRVKCRECGHIHEVLPDFIRPHGRYGQFVREPAVQAVRRGEAAEQVARRMGLVPETVRRWVRELAGRLERASAALRSLLVRLAPGQIFPLHKRTRSPEETCARIVHILGGVPASSSPFGLVNILLSDSFQPMWL